MSLSISDAVENILAVHLYGNHHAVALPLGADIIVAGIDKIAISLPHLMIDALVFAAEE